MKNNRSFLIPLTAFAILLFAHVAHSQYRFDVFGAATKPLDKDFEITSPQSTVPMKGTQSFSLGGRGGVRLGYDGKGHWGQDFEYSYGSNASKITNKSNGGQFALKIRTHRFSYNAIWYPAGLSPNKKVFPYLTAGVGGIFFTLPQSTINEALDPGRAGLGQLRSENVVAFNTGAGVRIRINRVYGLRFEVRDTMSRAVRYGLPKSSSDPTATVFPIGGVFHQLDFSISFVYYF
jgi:hypothetical protein